MRKIHLLILWLLSGLSLWAQNEVPRKGFSAPFDFSLYLSGNFGELRENHFHGGLDFKTQHVSGKKLLALADGYVNRVQVSHDSGYVLHVRYNNGFTTINRHLEGLVGPLADFVDSIQYKNQRWVMNAEFKPNEYPVRRGEHIGWSGNLGYSFAPHLHLDVYETRSGDYIDPLPFYSEKLTDTKAPRSQGFMVYPERKKGVVNGDYRPLQVSLANKDSIFAWGTIGVAIKAYDYMDGTYNKYGVKHMKVYANDEFIFESNVDRYAYSEHKYINSWSHKDYMKAFIEPGNRLRMLQAKNGNRGLVTIGEEKTYTFKFVLSDYYGNTSTYKLNVYGKQQDIVAPNSTKELAWDTFNHFSDAGLNLVIPKNQLYKTADLDYQLFPKSSRDSVESFIYQLIAPDDYVPFHRWAKLSIRVPENYSLDKKKLYIARINEKNKLVNVGGTLKNGAIETTISKLGTFTLAIDTVPPVVYALDKHNWKKQGQIVFKAKDYETGIMSYKGTIDGEYALFYLDIMPDNICYNIDSRRLQRGVNHKIQLEVIDKRGNKTLINETFFW